MIKSNSDVFNLTVAVNPTAEQVATNTTIVPEPGGGFRFAATGHYSIVDIPPANTPMRYYRSTEAYLNDFLGLGKATLRGSAVLTVASS